MTKDEFRLVYGLTWLQKTWSRAKIRKILNASWPAKKSKNYFYAEILSRRGNSH